MTELFTTQPTGVAAILMALAFLLNVIARGLAPILAACAAVIRDIGAAAVEAIKAWTKRTNDERDCAPKLADALARIGKLERLAKAAVAGEQRAIDDAAAGAATIAEHVHVIERGDEPTGDQRLPAGIPPLPNRRKR